MSRAELRNAAEALLPDSQGVPNSGLLSEINAVNLLEQQLSSAHNSLSSLIGSQYEDISAGARPNGYMSDVRRFFCLFVLFDFLLISLTWLICLMLIGTDNILEMLKKQIVYYKISTSLFDLVLAAFCRFTILLLFYGLLYLNTVFFVAFTTLSTSLFLIFKVIYYSWSTASQPAFQVVLVLISFVITWSEAWFLDFRVVPQELLAASRARSTGRFSESLNNFLLDRNLRNPLTRFLLNLNPQTGEGASNESYYSPLQSPEDSDDSNDDTMSRKNIRGEYLRRGKETLELAWTILNDCDWKLRKKTSEGDSVYSKSEQNFGKFYLLRAKINVEAQKLLEELFLHVDTLKTWNKKVLESKRILVLDEHTDITYQVSSPGGNGVIGSRDFINLRHWDIKGDSYVLAGISVTYPTLPPVKNYIRGENGPCCWAIRPLGENYDSCMFEFLLNTNLKGWIPPYVLDSALISVLLEYSSCLKEHCNSISKLDNT